MSNPRPSAQHPLHLLYAEHHHWLRGWLARRLNSHADAADLTHDTFLRTLTSPHLGQLDEPRGITPISPCWASAVSTGTPQSR